jgi:TPR repeat protein
MKWFRRAADQGYDDAQMMLGNMYQKGKGVPRDYVHAYMWYTLAMQSKEPARPGLASVLRNGLLSSMSVEEMYEAERLAVEWKPTASSASDDHIETKTQRGASSVYESTDGPAPSRAATEPTSTPRAHANEMACKEGWESQQAQFSEITRLRGSSHHSSAIIPQKCVSAACPLEMCD